MNYWKRRRVDLFVFFAQCFTDCLVGSFCSIQMTLFHLFGIFHFVSSCYATGTQFPRRDLMRDYDNAAIASLNCLTLTLWFNWLTNRANRCYIPVTNKGFGAVTRYWRVLQTRFWELGVRITTNLMELEIEIPVPSLFCCSSDEFDCGAYMCIFVESHWFPLRWLMLIFRKFVVSFCHCTQSCMTDPRLNHLLLLSYLRAILRNQINWIYNWRILRETFVSSDLICLCS